MTCTFDRTKLVHQIIKRVTQKSPISNEHDTRCRLEWKWKSRVTRKFWTECWSSIKQMPNLHFGLTGVMATVLKTSNTLH